MITQNHIQTIAIIFEFQNELITELLGDLTDTTTTRLDSHVLCLLCESRQASYAALINLGAFEV
jgi:hypothetical protein